jgi:hypothetical protein
VSSRPEIQCLGQASRLLFRPGVPRTCERISGRRPDWTSAAKHALLGVGWWTWPPGGALRACPAICGALGRASVNSGAPRTNGAQDLVDPFNREVPESKERGTQKGERQIKRAKAAQGRARCGYRQETAAVKAARVAAAKTPVKADEPKVEHFLGPAQQCEHALLMQATDWQQHSVRGQEWSRRNSVSR